MIQYILLIGAILGFTSVMIDAYVTHILINTINLKTLSILKTAVHYHELYAVMIAFIGLICKARNDLRFLKISGWIFIIGIILFSFSIYFKIFFGAQFFINLAPVGGMFLMMGWLTLIFESLKYIKKQA